MRKTYPTLQLMDSIAEAEAHNASSFSRNALPRDCIEKIFNTILRPKSLRRLAVSPHPLKWRSIQQACTKNLIEDVSSWIETVDEPVKYDR